MITLKSERELEGMRESGKVLAGVHLGLRDMIKPGLTAYDIEEFANDYILEHGATPSEKVSRATNTQLVSMLTMKLPMVLLVRTLY